MYSLSANQGFAEAQYEIGFFLENGCVIDEWGSLSPIIPEEAFKWYSLAAKQGHR